MRLEEIDTFWVIISFLAISVIVLFILNKRTSDPLQDKLNKFKISLLLGGVFLVVMHMIMPNLGAFDYPWEASDIDTPEKILKYLQKQNDAIVRTIDIMRWTFFIMAFWVVASGYRFLSAFGDHLKKEKSGRNDEDSIS